MRQNKLAKTHFLQKIIALLHEHILLILLLLAGTFFRFINAFERYALGNESIRDASVAIIGAADWHFPLTGPFSSLGPFTTGPLYWWQLIIARILLPTNYAPWIFIGITSILFVFIMYKIGELLEGKLLGFTIAILAAFSAYIISWSTTLTNPAGIFLYAALSIWIFLKIIKHKVSPLWGLALGLSIGIGISTHYQMTAYLIFVFAIAIYKRKNILFFFMSCLGLFLTYLPFFIFDLMHNWHMLRAIFYSYIHMSERIYVANSWKIYLFQFWPESFSKTLVLPKEIGIALMISSLLILGIYFFKRKPSKEIIMLSVIFFLLFLQLRYYQGERFMGYIHYMMPFMFIFIGLSLWSISRLKFGNIFYSILLIAILALMLPATVKQIQPEPLTVARIMKTHLLTSHFTNQKMRLYQCKKEIPNELLSLVFLLEKQNKLDENGIQLTLTSEQCAKNLKKDSPVSISDIALSHTASVAELHTPNETTLKKYYWEPVTIRTIFDESVLWWKKEKL